MKSEKKRIIKAAVARAGYERNVDRLCDLTGMPRTTYYGKLRDPDSITVGQLMRLDMVLKFRDEDLLSLVRR